MNYTKSPGCPLKQLFSPVEHLPDIQTCDHLRRKSRPCVYGPLPVIRVHMDPVGRSFRVPSENFGVNAISFGLYPAIGSLEGPWPVGQNTGRWPRNSSGDGERSAR
jgi:hypothetical protein